jgi:hypothetical protein
MEFHRRPPESLCVNIKFRFAPPSFSYIPFKPNKLPVQLVSFSINPFYVPLFKVRIIVLLETVVAVTCVWWDLMEDRPDVFQKSSDHTVSVQYRFTFVFKTATPRLTLADYGLCQAVVVHINRLHYDDTVRYSKVLLHCANRSYNVTN